jgi:putative component of membrane protein insertase Oxa1/YidC/SpoIIIJ protein YidD
VRRAAAVVAGIASVACQPVARVGSHCAGERPFAPFDDRRPATSNASAPADAAAPGASDAAPPDGLLDAVVAWYQHHGRARTLPGIGCPFAPTCSAYARAALRRYGPLAVILIVDRLFVREHAVAGAYYPTICVAHTTRLVDGVP